MSDFNSSLPIRTQNNGDAAVKVVDGTTPSQTLTVDASGRISVKTLDGTGTPLTSQVNGSQQALDVGINVAGVQIDPRSIRALTSSDVVTAAQGAPNTAANGWPVKLTDGTNTASLTGAGEVKVDITQPLPAGTNLIGATNLYVGGSANSNVNPVYVSITSASGTPVDSYQTSAALAAAGSVNLDYTVTAGKTWTGKQLWATASGKIKVTLQFETAAGSGTFNTFWVGFNSTANPAVLIPITSGKTQVAGAKVRVVIVNNDVSPMDVYETLSGTEA